MGEIVRLYYDNGIWMAVLDDDSSVPLKQVSPEAESLLLHYNDIRESNGATQFKRSIDKKWVSYDAVFSATEKLRASQSTRQNGTTQETPSVPVDVTDPTGEIRRRIAELRAEGNTIAAQRYQAFLDNPTQSNLDAAQVVAREGDDTLLQAVFDQQPDKLSKAEIEAQQRDAILMEIYRQGIANPSDGSDVMAAYRMANALFPQFLEQWVASNAAKKAQQKPEVTFEEFISGMTIPLELMDSYRGDSAARQTAADAEAKRKQQEEQLKAAVPMDAAIRQAILVNDLFWTRMCRT